MFSRPKILFLVSLLFVALLNPKLNPYLLFKFLFFYHSIYTYNHSLEIPPLKNPGSAPGEIFTNATLLALAEIFMIQKFTTLSSCNQHLTRFTGLL